MGSTDLEDVIVKFTSLTEKPVKYLSIQNDIKDDIKSLIRSLYNYTKSQEKPSKSKSNQALSKIIVDDFDEEQIWQQIDLQNAQCYDQFTWDVASIISNKSDLNFPIQFSKQSEIENSEQDTDCVENEADLSSNELEQDVNLETSDSEVRSRKNNVKIKSKPSIVDDKFFKLQDMEKFLLNEEKLEGKIKKDEDSDSVDFFEDIDDEDSENDHGKEVMYSDFFNEDHENDKQQNGDEIDENDSEEQSDQEIKNTSINGTGKQKKQVRFSSLNSDDDDDDNESDDSQDEPPTKKPKVDTGKEKQSDFEKRQQRLKQQISKLEEKSLIEAPWQLKGEVDAKKRPENSLLQEVLDFDLTTRPPPTITEQTTLTLEGLITQRIKDKAWDDVERKDKPVDDQLDFKKSVVLDQSKSKLSLAQVYESEYLKQKQALSGEVNEEEPESHKEIRNSMTKLFAKLDALCHYHYTPKAPQAEVKIVSNTPAISMEEVAPVATSDATLLAPEEIKRKQKGDLVSKDERTKTDKNRERRRKKKLQRSKGNVMKVTDQRNTKKGVEASDKSLKTSKAFFQQLNDEASSLIKSKNKKPVKNK